MNQTIQIMKNRYVCIHQIFKPKYQSKILMEGSGDCSICKKSPDNLKCSRYFGINIGTFEVKEKK
jgi:hypothetical protein